MAKRKVGAFAVIPPSGIRPHAIMPAFSSQGQSALSTIEYHDTLAPATIPYLLDGFGCCYYHRRR